MADEFRTLLSSKDIQERWVPIGNGAFARVVAIDPSIAAGGIVPDSTPVAATHLILSTVAGLLCSMSCLPSVDGFVMVFDQDELPDDGTVAPIYVGTVYAGAGRDWAWPIPLELENGCVIAFSSTGPFNLTATAAFLTAQFVPTA